MTQTTGAMKAIRDRVQQQKILDIERAAKRKEAEQCVTRALAKYRQLVDARDTAAREWPLTEREAKIWARKIGTAEAILTAAVERWEAMPR